MEKPARRVKKVAKTSLMNTAKPKVQAKEKVPAIPVDVSTGWREEEELWIMNPSTSHAFPQPEIFPSQKIGCALLYLDKQAVLLLAMNLAQGRRMMHPWRGRNAAQILRKTSSGARRLKMMQDAYQPPYRVGAAVTLV